MCLDGFSAQHGENVIITIASTYKKIVWAIIEASIAYLLLSVGSLKPLQTASIAASLPFLFIMIALCPALLTAFGLSRGIRWMFWPMKISRKNPERWENNRIYHVRPDNRL